MGPAAFFLLFAGLLRPEAVGAPPLTAEGLRQISALQDEKAGRTPAQHKMDSQLIYAAKQLRGVPIAAGVTNLQIHVRYETDGRMLIDVNGAVTKDVVAVIEAAGGTVVSRFPKFRTLRALLPIGQIETVAALGDVRSIRRPAMAETRTGSVTSEGDLAHNAATARSTLGADGTGVKIGVLSDSCDYYTTSQASGDLGTLTILPGQSGIGSGNTGEGTAMLEIVHDLAPGASLYFATAFISEPQFAQNILDLRSAGCDIIVDDVGYFDEPVFHDGIVAQAVDTVTADGALYFSSAANSGNLTDGTSGTWEGDFVDGGPAGTPVNGKGGRLHSFGGGSNYNVSVAGGSDYRVDLFWADPWGASTNDYDVYVLNSGGTTVLGSSTTTQNGSQDPYESIDILSAGNRIAIVKASGGARFLHLETGRGVLAIQTMGNTHGHSAASNAFSVAAVSAAGRSSAFTGGGANPVESFSSDGLRRVFFYPDGTPVTPGNFSSSGGLVRQKPDISAADGVLTAVPGFSRFFGTSAAAPHAGAIAALLKSYAPALTPAQIRTALTSTALDIMAAGPDRDSGAGIVMPLAAMQSLPIPFPILAGAQFSDTTGGNGNGYLDPGETIMETVTWTNIGGATVSNITAALTTGAAGVTMVQTSSAYAAIVPSSSGTNTSPYSYRLAKSVAGGTALVFTNRLTAGGQVFTGVFTRIVGRPGFVTNQYVSTDVPKAIPDVATAYSTNLVSAGLQAIDDVNVALRINHTFDGDLIIAVQHPDATEVLLALNRGVSGHNFGTGTPPGPTTNTLFDDQAATAIASGSAPFINAGGYKPDGVLSQFNGKAVSGAWRLRTSDTAAQDAGTNLGWNLTIVSHSNIYAVALFNNPPTASNQNLTAYSGLATNLVLSGGDVDGDALSFQTNGAPAHGILSAFNTNSGAIVYTATPGYAGPDSFSFSAWDGTANSASATVSVTVISSGVYTVSVAAAANGAISPSGNVAVAAGGDATFTMTPAPYYHLTNVVVDGVGRGAINPCVLTNVLANHSFAAFFAADLAPLGTPVWWLAQYGLTNGGVAAAELADPDYDGLYTWQEYVTGTDPTNPASVLRMRGVSSDGLTDTVKWLSSALAPGYNLLYNTNLTSLSWTIYSSGIPPTPPTNSSSLPFHGYPSFYKVTVTN